MIPQRVALYYGPHVAVFTVGYVVFSYASIPGDVMEEFGVGFTVTVGAAQIGWVYDGDRASRQEGFYGGALTLGGAVAFLLTPRIIEVTGWFGVHAVGGLVAVPVAALLWRERSADGALPGEEEAKEVAKTAAKRGPEIPEENSTPSADTHDRTPSPLTNRLVLLAAGLYVATLGAYITLSTFVTAFFDDLGVIAPLNAVALFAASLGRIGGGLAIVRPGINDGRLIAAATAVGTVGLLGLVVSEGAL